MKNVIVSLLCIAFVLSCAGGLSQEEKAELVRAQREARQREYENNARIAETLYGHCTETYQNADSSALLLMVKTAIDGSIDANLSQMETVSAVWNYAITVSVYTGETSPSLELARTIQELEQTGVSLIIRASYNCIEYGMQLLKSRHANVSSPFSELLEYYSLYAQVYESANNPSGSYTSYSQSIGVMRSERQRLASKLRILLQ